jgi:hypothetical protein
MGKRRASAFCVRVVEGEELSYPVWMTLCAVFLWFFVVILFSHIKWASGYQLLRGGACGGVWRVLRRQKSELDEVQKGQKTMTFHHAIRGVDASNERDKKSVPASSLTYSLYRYSNERQKSRGSSRSACKHSPQRPVREWRGAWA